MTSSPCTPIPNRGPFVSRTTDAGVRTAGERRAPQHISRRGCACVSKNYNGQVEKATVSRLKNSLSAYLRKVRAGHSVVVYDRDVPIARIDRIEDGGAGDDRLALLAAQGITGPPEAELSAKRLRQALSRPLARSVRLLDAVLEERREGR